MSHEPPTPPADPSTHAPQVRWTAVSRSKILPGPGNVPARTPLPDALQALQRLGEEDRHTRHEFEAGIDRNEPATVERVRQVLRSYAEPAAFLGRPLDIAIEAVRGAVAEWTIQHDQPGLDLDSGEIAGGLGFAVEAALCARKYEHERSFEGSGGS